MRKKSDYLWMANPDAKSCPGPNRTINQYGSQTCMPCFSMVNLYTIGRVWTSEFDLNTLRVDRKIFESVKKKLCIQKYPVDTCGPGLYNASKDEFNE